MEMERRRKSGCECGEVHKRNSQKEMRTLRIINNCTSKWWRVLSNFKDLLIKIFHQKTKINYRNYFQSHFCVVIFFVSHSLWPLCMFVCIHSSRECPNREGFCSCFWFDNRHQHIHPLWHLDLNEEDLDGRFWGGLQHIQETLSFLFHLDLKWKMNSKNNSVFSWNSLFD